MKLPLIKIAVTCMLVLTTNIALADVAKSEKHAKSATKLRHAVFTMLGANMGTLGGMAKGKIPFDAKVIEKSATRMNQLSLMIADYTKTDTSAFNVQTEASPKVWNNRGEFEKRINALTLASSKLMIAAQSGDKNTIKSAIGGVGKTCGGCHKNFKQD